MRRLLILISIISFSTTAIAIPFSDFQYAQLPSSTEDETGNTNLDSNNGLFQKPPSPLNDGYATLEVPFEMNIDTLTLLAEQKGEAQAGQLLFDCKGEKSLCYMGNDYYPNDMARPFKGICADANGWVNNSGYFPGSGPDGRYCSFPKYYYSCATASATAQSKECYSDCPGTGIQGNVQRKAP